MTIFLNFMKNMCIKRVLYDILFHVTLVAKNDFSVLRKPTRRTSQWRNKHVNASQPRLEHRIARIKRGTRRVNTIREGTHDAAYYNTNIVNVPSTAEWYTTNEP